MTNHLDNFDGLNDGFTKDSKHFSIYCTNHWCYLLYISSMINDDLQPHGKLMVCHNRYWIHIFFMLNTHLHSCYLIECNIMNDEK